MRILWDTIQFRLVGFIDRRSRDLMIAERRRSDRVIEQRWREKVAGNVKEQRRLSAERRWDRCAAPGLIREGQTAAQVRPTALEHALTAPGLLRRQA